MIFLRVAFFGMLKHWKRTLLVVFAIASSVLMMEFLAGMLEGIRVNFYKTSIRDSGHVSIHASGWKERLNPLSLSFPIEEYGNLLSGIRVLPGVLTAEAVLPFGAMLVNGERNVTMQGTGVSSGSFFFSKIRDGLVSGSFLPGGKGISLSEKTASLLGVVLGGRITVLTEDSSGSPFYLEMPVTGIFRTGSLEFDENNFFVGHESAQELVYLPESTLELRVDLADREAAETVRDAIMAIDGGKGLEGETWQETNGSFLVFITLFDSLMVGINILVVLVASTVITNAVLMNLFERTREFGTLRAIGLKKRQLFGLILAEGLVLGLAGALVGFLISLPIVLGLQARGLPLGEISEFFGTGSVVAFAFSPANSLKNFVSGTMIAVLGSLYAGVVSTKLSIMQSLSDR